MALGEWGLPCLLILTLLIHSVMPGQPLVVCSTRIFGAPGVIPCRRLLQALPNSGDDGARLFDEEQLRNAGAFWPGSINPFPAPIAQMPKYWSNGESEYKL